MLNDKDENYEPTEESEYHFSDDDVSYEVDSQETKKSSTGVAQKLSFLNRLSQSKRILISFVVFVVLIFIVYKMIAPNTGQVSTEITPAVVASQQSKTPQQVSQPVANNQTIATNAPLTAPSPAAPAMPSQAMPATMPSTVTGQGTTTSTMGNNLSSSSTSSPMGAMGTSPTQPASNQTQMATQQTINNSQQTILAQQPMANQLQSQQMANQSQQLAAQQQVPSKQQLASQQYISTQPMAQQQNMPQQAMPVQQNMGTSQMMPTQQGMVQQQLPSQPSAPLGVIPSVIPVQSAVPQYNQPTTNVVSQMFPGVDASRIAGLNADSQRLISQLQSDYIQKTNDYMAQNKQIHDQVQALNTRVMTIESQMKQLIQALTRQPETTRSVSTQQPTSIAAPIEHMAEPRISYNVQAIIPGRAWLRSDAGETVTVAEGDMIKNLGRVTKIDPYDGVVEVNTGNKIVSLSYGSGE